MTGLRIGLLYKRRGNYALQARFAGDSSVVDETDAEVRHHEEALKKAGYAVQRICWGPDIIAELERAQVDLVFNVSSMAEAALLEETGVPYVGSDPFGIALATEKSLAKRLWQHAGLPTSPFVVAETEEDCRSFRDHPPFGYPLFVKPVAGRGSAGIDEASVVSSYGELIDSFGARRHTMGQPVLIERFLQGREVTLGILGNDGDARPLPPLEIVYRGDDVTLSYEKKELDDDTFLCPAPLSREQTRLMQELALQAYRTLGLRDFGRIDTILTPEGPFLLEANSFAGLMCTPREKPHSYMGFMARAEGMGGPELLHEVVQAAVKRLGLEMRG